MNFDKEYEKHYPESKKDIIVYIEHGSIDKKTGKLKEYEIEKNFKTGKTLCSCPSYNFRPYTDCKHITNLKNKIKW